METRWRHWRPDVWNGLELPSWGWVTCLHWLLLNATHCSMYVDWRTCRMHDNPHLVYVDPDMVGRTKASPADGTTSDQDLGTSDDDVKFLMLHRNRISVMESPLTPDRMPRLEMLSLYGNPLSCGCHSDWIREEVTAPVWMFIFKCIYYDCKNNFFLQ